MLAFSNKHDSKDRRRTRQGTQPPFPPPLAYVCFQRLASVGEASVVGATAAGVSVAAALVAGASVAAASVAAASVAAASVAAASVAAASVAAASVAGASVAAVSVAGASVVGASVSAGQSPWPVPASQSKKCGRGQGGGATTWKQVCWPKWSCSESTALRCAEGRSLTWAANPGVPFLRRADLPVSTLRRVNDIRFVTAI